MSQRRDEISDRSPVSPRLIAAGVVVVLLVVFILQNTDKGKIQFLVLEKETPIWVALFVAMLLGAAVGALLARARRN